MAPLLEVDNLVIDAVKDDGSLLPIVKGVSFKLDRGEVVALIGESGSGKTTIALSALGYAKPGLEFSGGEVVLTVSMSFRCLRTKYGSYAVNALPISRKVQRHRSTLH